MAPDSGPRRLRVTRAFGIPVYIHLSWLLVFGLIAWTLATAYFPAREPGLSPAAYWTRGVAATLLFFLSVLLHEMGHALVAQRSGIGIRSITLFVFGGVSQLEKDPEGGRAEMRMAAAGPAVSLVLAGIFHLAALPPVLGAGGRSVARYLAVMNLALGLFNLVPAFPLDGGRLLRGALWPTQGKVKATRIAAGAGSFVASMLMILGVVAFVSGFGVAGLWYFLIGWFLDQSASGAYRQTRLDEALRGLTVRDAMVRQVATLPAHISLAEAARDHVIHTGYGGYPVLRDDRVVGLLSLRDILKVPADERERTAVQAVATPLGEAVAVGPDEPLLGVLGKMVRGGLGRLLVVEDGRLVGLLTLNAVMRHARIREELAA